MRGGIVKCLSLPSKPDPAVTPRYGVQSDRRWRTRNELARGRESVWPPILAVVTEVDAVAVVEHSEGERLEKSFEKLVLRLRRARIFECKANEGWAIVPVAVSRRSWLLLGVFEVHDDAAEPVNGLGALLLVFEYGIGSGKVDYAL